MKRLSVYFFVIALFLGVAWILVGAFKQTTIGGCPKSGNMNLVSDISEETKVSSSGLALSPDCIMLHQPDIEKTAFEQCLQRAKEGDMVAQYFLALYYEKGIGVDQNPQEMLNWLKKAAEQGHAEARQKIEAYYTAFSKDMEQIVFEKCQKLAESGDKNAQYRLACYYEMGFYVPKSIAQAMHWFNQAAHQDHPAAYNKMGLYYEIGVLQHQNYEKAFKSYRKGADGGDAEAQASLGRLYYSGCGCSQDKTLAVYYLQMAVEKGDINAKYLLGKCYENGEGTLPCDATKAKQLYEEAAAGGHEIAAQELKKIQD